ncbi:hypothetical protein BJ322DRAFT_204065 [Thelephora terrestris]|uniref:Uncharacterized protein n=1 Tax=Thelephora terrestris TaxID=56493 RepID=A0A9P6HC36_9AGAM|nr:hypothetical protein BJ322DRAFT_204065 [Thelephora terrestris]
MADSKHPRRRKSPSLKLSTDSIPPQLPLYSSPPQTASGWSRFDPFADNPPDYPESSEADADESDQEVPVHKRRQASPQIYVSPFQSSPRKTRRPPFHSPSPSLTSHRTRHHARTSAFRHAATNSDTYLDSLLARSVHALEISNTLLQSSIATNSSMSSVLSADSPGDEGLEESANGLSKRIMKSRDLQKDWIDDLEEIGNRVDSLFGEQTEMEGGSRQPCRGNGRGSQVPVMPPSRDATSSVSQSLPISSGFPQTLVERRRGHHSPSLTVVTPTTLEGRLDYSAHSRSHFVAPPPRALTVYIGSDDIDPGAIKLPPTLGIRSPPQPAHSHLFQSAASSASPSPVSSRRTSFSNGQGAGTHRSESSTPVAVRAYDILSSFVSAQRGPDKVTRSQSFGANTSPTMPVNAWRTHASPTLSEISNVSTSPTKSRGRSLTSLRTTQIDSQSNTPGSMSKPLTPPIEELPCANSSSESDTQTNLAVTSLRKIFMDDQALAIEREKQLSASRSLSNSTTGSRMRPPPRLLAPPTLPEASTSHATASVTRLLTKNKHSSSTRPTSPPRQSSLRSPSARSPPLSPSPSPSPSLLNIPHLFGGGSGGSNNGSGRSTPNRVSFAALPESYANSKPGGPDGQFNRERRRKQRKPSGRTPLKSHSRSRSLEDYSDDGQGWGWANWLLAGNNVGTAALRFDQEARWGLRPSPI